MLFGKKERGFEENYFESSGVEDDASDGSDENCNEIELTSEDEKEVESEDEDDTASNEQGWQKTHFYLKSPKTHVFF